MKNECINVCEYVYNVQKGRGAGYAKNIFVFDLQGKNKHNLKNNKMSLKE